MLVDVGATEVGAMVVTGAAGLPEVPEPLAQKTVAPPSSPVLVDSPTILLPHWQYVFSGNVCEPMVVAGADVSLQAVGGGE